MKKNQKLQTGMWMNKQNEQTKDIDKIGLWDVIDISYVSLFSLGILFCWVLLLV